MKSIKVSKYQSIKGWQAFMLASLIALILCLTAFIGTGIAGDVQKNEAVSITQTYKVWCYDKGGNLKWYDEIHNLVVTEGLNKYLDSTIKTGATSPVWYVGLLKYDAAHNTVALTDTAAKITTGTPNPPTTNDWPESTAFDEATRPEYVEGTISGGSIDNSASKAVFTMNATTTIAGCFLINNSTKGGTTGTILGGGNFTGGNRAVVDNDVLNVQVTSTIVN